MYINISKLKESTKYINKDTLFSSEYSGLELSLYSLINDDIPLFERILERFKNDIPFRSYLDFSNETKSYNIFHLAIIMENLPFIKRLLLVDGSLVLSKTSNKMTTLMLACLRGNYDFAKLMLSRGCKIDEVNHTKNSALHFAVYSKNLDIIKLLLFHKANINVKNSDGVTPLMMAVIRDNDIANFLILSGADVNIISRIKPNKVGTSALGHILRNMRNENPSLIDTVDLLIKKGADINVQYDNSKTIEQHITEGNYPIIKDLLSKSKNPNFLQPNYNLVFSQEVLNRISTSIHSGTIEEKISQIIIRGLSNN